MCYWTLTTNLTFERLHQIEKEAKINNDSHGFMCLDCDVLEISLEFSNEYQNKMLKHFLHSVISHSRITSMGETSLSNCQPIQSYTKNVLVHNGTCSLKKVIELRDKVNATLRGVDISDTVSMTILLDNAKTEEEQKLLMSEFNSNDWIGNLAYYRHGTNKILLDLENGYYNEKLSYVETLGSDSIKGYFDIEKKEFNVKVVKGLTHYKGSWLDKYYDYQYQADFNSCDVPALEEKDKCLFDKDKLNCNTRQNGITYICNVHNCSYEWCNCPNSETFTLLEEEEEEPAEKQEEYFYDKDYETIHYKELFF